MQNENSCFNDDFANITADENSSSYNSTTYGGENESSFFPDELFPSPENHGSFYSSLFSDSSTTPSGSSSDGSDPNAVDQSLHQASYVLQYQKLYNRYALCLSHLQEAVKEIEALRGENAELAQSLRLLYDFNRLDIVGDGSSAAFATPPPVEHNLNHERLSLPKSISVRSGSYLKFKPSKGSSQSHNWFGHLVRDSLAGAETLVPVAKREEEKIDLEAYNQGMLKTELCNKWEETGACPYGDNCRFAHGVNELRPVIRHPRYKTQVCRMVLAGKPCPYGHRCHFRHSLTRQERFTASKTHS